MAASPPDAGALAREIARAAEAGLDPTEVTGLIQRVDALFAAHQDVVYAACLRAVRDPERAVELAQDSLLRAYEKLGTFRGESQFRTWLLGIARYECINAARRRRDLLAEDGVIEVADPESGTLSSLHRHERDTLVRAAAEAVLDATEQEVVWLRYAEHVSIEQINEILGLDAASGARGVLQRCKRKLGREIRRRLGELGHGSSFVHGSSG